MSALNVTQEEADLLLVSLKMYSDVQLNASGVVSEDVKTLMAKLMPAPVVAVDPPDVVAAEKLIEAHLAAEEAAPTPKTKKTKVVEE